MLVATPAKTRTATATTPTPIGCKLLKINLLSTPPSQRRRFERCAFYRYFRMRQLLFSKTLHQTFVFRAVFRHCVFDSRLALRFKEVRILQSKDASSTTFAEVFLNNCDAGEFPLANLGHHGRAHGDAHAFISDAFAIEANATAGDLANGIRGAGHQSGQLQ
jgi:hypothetical protein